MSNELLDPTAKSKDFLAAFAMILMSEIGDRTFFIAAVLAMRHGAGTVFAGCAGALAFMTILSVIVGSTLPLLLSPKVTHWSGACLFLFFGVKLLWEVMQAESSKEDEREAAETALEKRDGTASDWRSVVTQAFIMTFLAEWGDRSQIATIVLAAVRNGIAVSAGAVFGHSLCTGLACAGGKALSSKISERAVNLAGGILFLLFATAAAVHSP